MQPRPRLIVSIVSTLFVLFLTNISIVLFLTWKTSVPLLHSKWYLLTLIYVHVAAYLVLYYLRDQFNANSVTGQRNTVGISNTLSLSRISAAPTLALLLTNISYIELRIPVLVLISLTFFTDFLDGKLARALNSETIIGKYIDSCSDYIISITIFGILGYYAILSRLFLILVYIRLFLPLLAVFIMFLSFRRTDFYRSWLGKSSVFAMMACSITALVLSLFLPEDTSKMVIRILEIITLAVFIVPSMIHRTWFLIIAARNARRAA